MSAALLVIDVQQSFEHRSYWSKDDLPAFQQQLLTLYSTNDIKQRTQLVLDGRFARVCSVEQIVEILNSKEFDHA